MELGSIGMFFQISALILCLASVAAYIYAYITKSYNIKSIGNWLFIGTTIAIIIASLVLFMAFAISDFSIDYVARYSDNSLPMFYKISAFWGGQAGSLLLWLPEYFSKTTL